METNKQLRDMENKFQGKLDHNDYNILMFGMMFYRFVSDDNEWNINDEHRFEEVEKKAATATLTVEEIISILETIQKGFLPEYKDVFTDSISTMKELSVRLKDFDGVVREVVESVASFGNIDAGLVSNFIERTALSENKGGAETYSPKSIQNVLAAIANLYGHKSLMDQALGTGSTLAAVGSPDNHFYGEEVNARTARFAKMNMVMQGIHPENITIEVGDTLQNDKFQSVDADLVVSVPPFSLRWDSKNADEGRFPFGVPSSSRADYAFIQTMLSHTSDSGYALAVVAHGTLFRSGAEGKIRQNVVESGHVSAVISLPERLLVGTSIPVAILVLSKKPSENVLFIDASREFDAGRLFNTLNDDQVQKIADTLSDRKTVERYAQLVGIDEVREQQFNLNVSRYVDTYEATEVADLTELNELLAQYKKAEAEAMERYEAAKISAEQMLAK